MNIDKDKMFAYMGSKSKNSMLGNYARNWIGVKGTRVMSKLSGQMSEKDSKKLVEDHGMSFKNKDTQGGGKAYYDGKDHSVTLEKGMRSKPIILHELGHGLQNKTEGTYNHAFMKKALAGEGYKDHDELGAKTMRIEREAWVKAKKLNGGKEGLKQKLTRKAALKSYEGALNLNAQNVKFQTDKDYRNYMLKRTGKKLAGATVGGVAGNLVSKKLNAKMKARIYYLKNKKDKPYEEKKELYDLERKYKLRNRLSTAGGVVAGYALTKKFLT